MQVGILKTDHGPHSAEALAAATAGDIIEIAAGAEGETAIAGRKLELQIIEVLEAHHEALESAEKFKLASDTTRVNEPHDVHDTVDAALQEIVEIASKTQWAAVFHDPEVQKHLHHVLGKWFSTNQHVHRGWHAHANKDHPAVKEYHARWNTV